MDALEAIAQRHSTRAYRSEELTRELLEKIVNAGRLAATGRNVQPWEFVIVTEPETRAKIAELADYGKFIADAGACVAVFCQDTKYFLEDGSAATQNMLIAATALGVQSCWVCGYGKDYAPKIGELLGAARGYQLVSLVALGRGATDRGATPKRPLSEVLHWERF